MPASSVWKPVADTSAWKPVTEEAPKTREQRTLEQYDQFEKAGAAESERVAGMSLTDKAIEGAKYFGKAVVAPITGIPNAISEVLTYLSNPREWLKKNLDPEQSNNYPGAAAGDPATGAIGLLEMAAGGSRGAAKAADAKRAAVMERMGVAPDPVAPPTAAPSVTPGLLRKVAENVAMKHPTVKAGLLAIDIAKAVREALNEPTALAPTVPKVVLPETTPAVAKTPRVPIPIKEPLSAAIPETPAPVVEPAATSASVAQAPAPSVPAVSAIPENATPAELGKFPAKQVAEFLKERMNRPKRPELVPADHAPVAQIEPPTVAPVVEMPAPAPGKVVTIPSPKAEFPAEMYEASARTAKTQAVAKFLHDKGATYADVRKLVSDSDPAAVKAFLNEATTQAGQKALNSAKSVEQMLFELKQLEKKAPAVNRNAKAAAIAKELAESMSQ